MGYYVGLDVSMKETALCIVDEAGRVVHEVKLDTEPETLAGFLRGTGLTFERVGLEAGPMSSWLYTGLAEAGLKVVCVEARHMKAALGAMRNKTDRNDARGLAQMMRTGWYRAVHVKSDESQELRLLLVNRQMLVNKRRDVENAIRGTLKIFGLKVGQVSRLRFEERVVELLVDHPSLLAMVRPMLEVRVALMEQYAVLHRMLLAAVRADDVCRRLMTIPGVGPVVALTFRAGVDVPERFAKSRSVGAHFGLTPRRYASGEIDRTGRISKCGDGMVRTSLFEAANVLLTRAKRWSALKAWGVRIARRAGLKKAVVAVARKLAVIMHRMWVDGSDFRWGRQAEIAA